MESKNVNENVKTCMNNAVVADALGTPDATNAGPCWNNSLT